MRTVLILKSTFPIETKPKYMYLNWKIFIPEFASPASSGVIWNKPLKICLSIMHADGAYKQ